MSGLTKFLRALRKADEAVLHVRIDMRSDAKLAEAIHAEFVRRQQRNAEPTGIK